ncbi:hypothetical protein V1477_015063 [Vespula maculifrons]|uniref:Uncharacterized protein n=1 Tax=Vespula maculifrons TaxID=7453 RepID=A0ABD2BJ72_VESMC
MRRDARLVKTNGFCVSLIMYLLIYKVSIELILINNSKLIGSKSTSEWRKIGHNFAMHTVEISDSRDCKKRKKERKRIQGYFCRNVFLANYEPT